ncbi:hypothetical protein [Ancylomarina longa]|uniref:Uncharacterized protein n=1 Tax=Ancylomarina longa TaxID=2487017 RepID=A0A434AX54_9BACT|nr:hypothetical protein [Ancylomarina longa]RUT79112.1 hypothetical protein DLK05_04650 [Ancylomarina longa]
MENNDMNLVPQTGPVAGEPAKSKVDLFSGEHTTSLIVGVLFIIVFIGLIIYVSVKTSYVNLILNGFFSLLSLLGGFFAGSQINKK